MPRYYSDSSESSSSYDSPPRRRHRQSNGRTRVREGGVVGANVHPPAPPRMLNQQQPIAHGQYPAIMGGSMCAQIQAPPIQMAHPSAQALHHMSQVPPQGRVETIPAVSQIGGPQRMEPVPFDDRTPAYGNITSTYPITNERERPMSNLPVWQTPVMPFSKSRDTSPYDVNRSPLALYQNQGLDQDSWRPKREQGLFFTPQPQNIYGMPAQAQVQRDRYQPSNNLTHQKPFEAEWSLRSGGFHPTTRILPTNVPVLRQQLISNRVNGPSKATSHPSGLFGTERGELGLVERRGFDSSCYYKVPFPTSAPNDAPTIRPKTEAGPTNRQATSKPYGGVADATGNGSGASYVRGQYIEAVQKLPSQLHQRIVEGGAAHLVQGGGSINRFEDVARTTLLEATENATMVTSVRAPVPAGTAQYMDEARATLLEGTELQVRSGNLNGTAEAPMTYLQDDAKPTLKQITSDHSYEGIARGLEAPMQTGAYDLAHLNEKLECAMNVDRAPVMGDINVSNTNADRVGYGDPSTVRIRDDLHLNLETTPNMAGESLVRWIPQVTVNENRVTEEKWLNCRNDSFQLSQLATNPLAQPLWNNTVQ